MEKVQINFEDMARAWGCPYVAREELKRFSGGLLSPRYMANLDAQERGIEGRIRVGRKIVYPTMNAVKFISARAQIVEPRATKQRGGRDEGAQS